MNRVVGGVGGGEEELITDKRTLCAGVRQRTWRYIRGSTFFVKMKIHDQIKNSNHLIRIFDLRKKRCFQSCSLRSKRFWLVSEQRKTEERAFRFGCSRIETRALLLAQFFALSLTLVPCSLLQDRTESSACHAAYQKRIIYDLWKDPLSWASPRHV